MVTPRKRADKPIWPVVLAAAAFLYLWWLAALLFDLVVAWHHYIRRSAILNRLIEIGRVPEQTYQPAPAEEKPAASGSAPDAETTASSKNHQSGERC